MESKKDVFKVISEEMAQFIGIADVKIKNHSERMKKISRDFAGNRLEKEEKSENQRFSEEMDMLRNAEIKKIGEIIDILSCKVINLMTRMNAESINEINALRVSKINLTRSEFDLLIEKYASESDYFAVKAILQLANDENIAYKDFSLETSLNALKNAFSECKWFIANYSGKKSDLTAADQAAMIRIENQIMNGLQTYSSEFYDNPLFGNQRFPEILRTSWLKEIDESNNKIDTKIRIGKEIQTLQFDTSGNRILERCVTLA